jgi:hypothetical protein
VQEGPAGVGVDLQALDDARAVEQAAQHGGVLPGAGGAGEVRDHCSWVSLPGSAASSAASALSASARQPLSAQRGSAKLDSATCTRPAATGRR